METKFNTTITLRISGVVRTAKGCPYADIEYDKSTKHKINNAFVRKFNKMLKKKYNDIGGWVAMLPSIVRTNDFKDKNGNFRTLKDIKEVKSE